MATFDPAVTSTAPAQALTYENTASVGVSTDDAAVDDRDELVASLRAGFAEVLGTAALEGDPLS